MFLFVYLQIELQIQNLRYRYEYVIGIGFIFYYQYKKMCNKMFKLELITSQYINILEFIVNIVICKVK